MKWLKHLIWKNITQDPQYAEVQVPCDEITIPQIDSDLYGKLLAEAEAGGMAFDGNKATGGGCSFYWSWDAPSETLHVQCVTKPFYITCDTIAGKIQSLITKARQGAI